MSEWQDPGGELPAGRDLDARIARALWPDFRVWCNNLDDEDRCVGRSPGLIAGPLPAFSSDLNAAWQAGTDLRKLWGLSLRLCYVQPGQTGALFYSSLPGDSVFDDAHEPRFEAFCDSPAEAICRAALKALAYGKP